MGQPDGTTGRAAIFPEENKKKLWYLHSPDKKARSYCVSSMKNAGSLKKKAQNSQSLKLWQQKLPKETLPSKLQILLSFFPKQNIKFM